MHSPSFKESTQMPLQGNQLYESCEKCKVIKRLILTLGLFKKKILTKWFYHYACSDCRFNVYPDQPTFLVMPDSLTSTRLKVSGSVVLAIWTEGLAVTSANGCRIAQFHLKNIRKFAYNLNEFKFWTGRACNLGVGTFTFITKQVNTFCFFSVEL